MTTLFNFADTSKFRSVDLKTKLHALRIKESMAPPESHFNRPASTKNQRNDLINELDSFQNSLRNSNVAAFNKIGISGSISNQGVSNNPNYKGLEGLERSLTSKMKNFHQDLKASNTHSPFLRNKSPSKIKVYQTVGANSLDSPRKKDYGDNYRPIISSSFFKRHLKEDVSNVIDSISPVSPLKRPRKSSPISQQDSTKLDFGGFGKLSSSNYKSTNSIINAFPVKQTVSLYNSLKKNDAKAFFNDTKPLFHDKKNSETRNLLNNRETLKTSFLKGRDSIGNNIVDLGGLNEISERLRGLGGREIESLSNSQVKELLNLANLITKIAKNTKYYN